MFTARRISLTAVVTAALLACTMSGVAAAWQDLRMPDTRDAANAATQKQDLRGEHARDAARADVIAAQMNAFKPAPLVPPKPAPVATSSDSTPWAIIGISLFAVLLAVGGTVVYARQPHRNTLARS